MPRPRGAAAAIPDELARAIVERDPAQPDRAVAAALGLPLPTVQRIRTALRRGGWSCPVRWAPCVVCGAPCVVVGRRTRHPRCQALGHRLAVQRVSQRRRPEIAGALLDRLIARRDAWQTETREQATNAGARWDDAEDAIVAETIHEPIREVALRLGRSYKAVYARRCVLRARGLADPPRRIADEWAALRQATA